MDLPTRAISIRQPWAYLVASGTKTMEIRTWATNYTGPLLIHASQKLDKVALEAFEEIIPVVGELAQGAYIATVYMTGCILLGKNSFEAHTSEHLNWAFYPGVRNGLYGHRYRDARWLSQPVPRRGQLGIYHVVDELQAIHEVIKHGKLPD
jgi:hypothetical protein